MEEGSFRGLQDKFEESELEAGLSVEGEQWEMLQGTWGHHFCTLERV